MTLGKGFDLATNREIGTILVYFQTTVTFFLIRSGDSGAICRSERKTSPTHLPEDYAKDTGTAET
jgi:hypothetical protein